jgi:hypothetical protein
MTSEVNEDSGKGNLALIKDSTNVFRKNEPFLPKPYFILKMIRSALDSSQPTTETAAE